MIPCCAFNLDCDVYMHDLVVLVNEYYQVMIIQGYICMQVA